MISFSSLNSAHSDWLRACRRMDSNAQPSTLASAAVGSVGPPSRAYSSRPLQTDRHIIALPRKGTLKASPPPSTRVEDPANAFLCLFLSAGQQAWGFDSLRDHPPRMAVTWRFHPRLHWRLHTGGGYTGVRLPLSPHLVEATRANGHAELSRAGLLRRQNIFFLSLSPYICIYLILGFDSFRNRVLGCDLCLG